MYKWRFTSFLLLLVSFIIISCDDEADIETDIDQEPMVTDTADDIHLRDTSMQNIEKAVAELSPTQGNDVTGTVEFTKVGDGIKVVANIEGLTPGKHGFHIHEKGDCSAPDGTSAGGHFSPQNSEHGSLDDQQSHSGDFGNIEAGEDGKAKAEFTTNKISFSGANSIIDKAIIVHANEDDLKSQPTGNAGPRVACGVIKQEGSMEKKVNPSSTTTDVYK